MPCVARTFLSPSTAIERPAFYILDLRFLDFRFHPHKANVSPLNSLNLLHFQLSILNFQLIKNRIFREIRPQLVSSPRELMACSHNPSFGMVNSVSVGIVPTIQEFSCSSFSNWLSVQPLYPAKKRISPSIPFRLSTSPSKP